MGVTGSVRGVLGAGRDFMYLGARRGIGASGGIGEFLGGVGGHFGVSVGIRGCQGCIGVASGLGA